MSRPQSVRCEGVWARYSTWPRRGRAVVFAAKPLDLDCVVADVDMREELELEGVSLSRTEDNDDRNNSPAVFSYVELTLTRPP